MLLAPEPHRYVNLRSAEKYLVEAEAGRLPEEGREALGPEELFAERLAMGLRLVSGVDWEKVCERYGQPVEPRRAEVARLVEHGFATLRDGRLALTEKGADVHSAVCARLL
jgi:oxygen-independent coproporphyrinogen-3 oxidase